jgi:two-component system, NarL family, sensor histidine kinase DevS
MTAPDPDAASPPDEERAHLDRLVAAVVAVAAGGSLPETLRHIVDAACDLVGARYGALGVIGYDQRLSQFVTHGVTEEEIAEIGPLPQGHGILGRLIVDPRPLRLRDLRAHPDSFGFPAGHPPMRSFLGVPIHLGDDVFGNLYLCEKQGAEEFSEHDEALAVSLAAVAAVAIDNLRLHERLQDLAVLQDRERIARELHDKVIQRIFATGMGLQAHARTVDGAESTRILEAVDELDAIIADIRASIFDLEARNADRPTLSVAVLDLVDDTTRDAPIEPTVRLVGPVNTLVDPELGDALLAVIRESLSNAIRHSGAHNVEVTVEAGPELVVTVHDDGRSKPGSLVNTTGHGLRNLATRAQVRGGTFRVGDAPGGGTLLEWRVPLTD